MLNKVIVESLNDKHIFEHFLSKINADIPNQPTVEHIENTNLSILKDEITDRIDFLQNSSILEKIKKILDDEKIVDIETLHSTDWFTLGGLSAESVRLKIKDLRRDILIAESKPKIIIIIDLDNKKIEERLNFLNTVISETLNININIDAPGDFKNFNLIESNESFDFELAYFFIGLNGSGEIEDLLIEIACREISFHADALQTTWRPYLTSQHGITLKDKDFNKIWIDFYKRYDCLNSKQKSNAGKYTKWDQFFRKHPEKFDFSKDIQELNELKSLLSQLII